MWNVLRVVVVVNYCFAMLYAISARGSFGMKGALGLLEGYRNKFNGREVTSCGEKERIGPLYEGK